MHQLPFWHLEKGAEECPDALNVKLNYKCQSKQKERSLTFPFLWPKSIPGCTNGKKEFSMFKFTCNSILGVNHQTYLSSRMEKEQQKKQSFPSCSTIFFPIFFTIKKCGHQPVVVPHRAFKYLIMRINSKQKSINTKVPNRDQI